MTRITVIKHQKSPAQTDQVSGYNILVGSKSYPAQIFHKSGGMIYLWEQVPLFVELGLYETFAIRFVPPFIDLTVHTVKS